MAARGKRTNSTVIFFRQFFMGSCEEVVAEIPSLPHQSGSIQHRELNASVLFDNLIHKINHMLDLMSANLLLMRSFFLNKVQMQ